MVLEYDKRKNGVLSTSLVFNVQLNPFPFIFCFSVVVFIVKNIVFLKISADNGRRVYESLTNIQASREGGVGGKLSRAQLSLGASPSPQNIKCTRVHHFEKKNSKKNFSKGAHEDVWGPQECFSGPRCGSRRAC